MLQKKLKSIFYSKKMGFRNSLPERFQNYGYGMPIDAMETHSYANASGFPYFLHRSKEVTKRNLPETPEKSVHWKYSLDNELTHHHPDVWVSVIPNAKIIGNNSYIITDNQKLLVGKSLQYDSKQYRDHKIFTHYLSLPKAKHLDGLTTIINANAGHLFYHWMMDALPRIAILKEIGINLSSIDHFIIPKTIHLPAILESLNLLGIDSNKCLESNKNSCYQSNNLLLTSIPGVPGNPSPWVRQFLRESYLDIASDIPDKFPRKFFISRKESRRILNESELLPILKKFDVVSVQPEKLSFIEQVALFARAKKIIAPHGAALSNLVFCQKNTSVFELFSPNYVNVCYWAIANLGDLKYSYLIGEGTRPPSGTDPHQIRNDMRISPKKFEDWLKKWV